MVLADWASAPRCVCGPNFISDLIGECPMPCRDFQKLAQQVILYSKINDELTFYQWGGIG